MEQQDTRFASFIIKSDPVIELAICAEHVLEATPITGAIRPLPAGVGFLEGFMHLRDDAIPVINMKKRLGLSPSDYAPDAKVAVVGLSKLRFGLLFDDIKDVLLVGSDSVHPIHPALQTPDSVISDLIKLDNGRRTLELLDLNRLLGDGNDLGQIQDEPASHRQTDGRTQGDSSRYVVFSCLDQDYGVPVGQVQEITFLAEMDDVFRNDAIEGALRLRGHCIPILDSSRLFQQQDAEPHTGDDVRILVLNTDEFQYGLIVDNIREIISIAEDDAMPVPGSRQSSVNGIYQHPDGRNIMLIRVDALIAGLKNQLRSVARLKSADEDEQGHATHLQAQHLITADCYLVFSIDRKFAIELNDVQEIIETSDVMDLPAESGFDRRVLNLRGCVIPVINLRQFYGFPKAETDSGGTKLIIARNGGRIIALEVDRILTIHKQIKYQNTPSLNPQLSNRADTLDRLIEFAGESGVHEHVLVINISAMMDNHLGLLNDNSTAMLEINAKENSYGSDSTTQP